MDSQAEVIVVGTSLGSVRRQFFGTKRVRHFLDCKKVPYYVIDANKDTSSARKLLDGKLFDQWRKAGLLMSDPVQVDNALLPQVLMNGVPVGDDNALQDLEEDGDFDWISSKNACPSCLHQIVQNVKKCSTCGIKLQELVPSDAWQNLMVLKFEGGLQVKPQAVAEDVARAKQHAFSRAMSVKLGQVNAHVQFSSGDESSGSD